MWKVYSELASTLAEESNGERDLRLPWCTVVSGQVDLNIGGACLDRLDNQVEQFDPSDPVEKANTLEWPGLPIFQKRFGNMSRVLENELRAERSEK